MFYVTYVFAELRRRLGRTILTALGLGLGVGLVVTVTALSNGLDRAQAQVLEPLTGVGTDMSVSRPIEFSDSGNGPFQQLSGEEREQLRSENGGGRFGLQNLGEPGEKFSRDTFVSNAQLSMPASDVSKISKIDGVEVAAGGLALNSLHIEGTVPEQQQPPGQFGPGAGGGPPENIDVSSLSVSGVDQTQEELGAVTPGQIVKGSYFGSGDARQAILNESYALERGPLGRRHRHAWWQELHRDRYRGDAARRAVLGRVREARRSCSSWPIARAASTPCTCAPSRPTTSPPCRRRSRTRSMGRP